MCIELPISAIAFVTKETKAILGGFEWILPTVKFAGNYLDSSKSKQMTQLNSRILNQGRFRWAVVGFD
jgi:hypothetical protein